MKNLALISPLTCVLILLLIATVSAIIFHRIKFPYTIGLVIVGLIIGILADHFQILEPFKQLHLTSNLILYVIIPILIFDAAVKIDSKLLVKNLKPILVLAAPGLVIATFITGILTAYISPLSFGAAMLFGALISATDPVAVIALFNELGAPKRLTMLVDGESLFNDATAIVMFTIIFGIISSGALGALTVIKGAVAFVFVFVGGLVVGIIIGRIMIFAISFAKNDPLIEVAFSTLVAFAAFLVANYYLKVSGVMAVVGAGMVVNWYGFTRFTPEVKTYIKNFWKYAAFVANSFIFIMLGLTEKIFINDLEHYTRMLLVVTGVIIIVTLARVVVVYGLVPVVNKLPGAEKIDRKYQTIIFWGGLRGAVPIALVLSLPQDFPFRHLLVELTLGVVFFTLIVQGTTVKKLMVRLGIGEETFAEKAEKFHALAASKEAVLNKISEISSHDIFPEKIIEKVKKEYKEEELLANKNLAELKKENKIPRNFEIKSFWMQAAAIEKKVYYDLFENNLISETALRELMLRTENLDYCIRKSEIPPFEDVAVQSKTGIIHKLIKFFHRIFTTRKYKIKKLTIKVEFLVAVTKAGMTITKSLPHLAKLNLAAPETVAPCVKFFEVRWRVAKQKLEHILKAHREMSEKISENILCRAALSEERKVIDELALNGGISERVKVKLKRSISS